MTVPLFNRNSAGVHAARADELRAEAERQRLELALRAEFAGVWAEYLSAARESETYRKEILPRAEEAYRLYLARYKEMAAAYPQVLVAQRRLLELSSEVPAQRRVGVAVGARPAGAPGRRRPRACGHGRRRPCSRHASRRCAMRRCCWWPPRSLAASALVEQAPALRSQSSGAVSRAGPWCTSCPDATRTALRTLEAGTIVRVGEDSR